AVIGVDGVDPQAGCTVYDQLGGRTAKALLRRARRAVVLADGSKFGKVALTQACALSDVDVLITDSSADTAVLDAISTRTVVV
ncbi:MAG TPA: alkaline phosphatase, partial [Mycobacteriales bacterium]|nr:alkaline phosphatase [Mycobacteriales bacterium]